MKMWIGNLDGERAGLVIASSKERARRIVGTSRADFDGFWVLQPTVDESLEVEKLYTRSMLDGVSSCSRHTATVTGTWQQGRCPLPGRR